MPKPTDVRVIGAALYLLPIRTRVPLKFGAETLTHVACARARLTVENRLGRVAEGWGETPLSVQWVWPSDSPYEARLDALVTLCKRLVQAWPEASLRGHPIEIGAAFQERILKQLLDERNRGRADAMPWLAALVCCSPFDIALHDAYGVVHEVPVFETYDAAHMNSDLSAYLADAEGDAAPFIGKFPRDYLVYPRPDRLPAWHLVGGMDPIDRTELDGEEPDDGYPVLLPDWIERDGIKCLKVKLRGTDAAWDYDRLVRVGRLGLERDVDWLSADFNCTVREVEYVNEILDRLMRDHPRIYGMILYVEQPFPYELEQFPTDVHSVSARKPLFMDESAHDWRLVRMGRKLGWTGVALKTCKTQTGALLSLCWAKAHGMTLMVQDLTNPMLAQVPHVLLAAHAGTIMGVETNSMQFYPEASRPEAQVHPGLYRRRNGQLDLSTIQGPGFGYRLAEIPRELPAPAAEFP